MQTRGVRGPARLHTMPSAFLLLNEDLHHIPIGAFGQASSHMPEPSELRPLPTKLMIG
jgi:hypothetical protein